MPDEFYLGYKWNPKAGRVSRRRVTFDLSSHVSMIAPTGTSKGVSIEIPNLLLGFRESSLISVDPSGQNLAVCGEARRAMGHRVLPINPKGLHVDRYPEMASVGFNPMTALNPRDPATFYSRADAIAEGLVPPSKERSGNSKFFEDSGRELGAWVTMYIKRRFGDDAHLGMVRDIVTEPEERDGDTPISGLHYHAACAVAFGDPQITSLASRYLYESRSNTEVISTFRAATGWLLDPDIRADLAVKNGVDFATLKHGAAPSDVFLILPAGTELIRFGPWLRIILNCALDTFYARADGRQVVLMISEAAQIGRLEPLLALIGQGRKYRIRLAPLVWQDIGQTREVYGPNGAGTLNAGSGCLFGFNPGNDSEGAEFLSRLSGDQLVPGLSASDDPQGGGNRGSYSAQRERLWSPEKIRSLPERHGLVWTTGGAAPQPVYCPPYWHIKACRRVAREDPFHGPMPPLPAGGWHWRAAALVAVAVSIVALVALMH